MHIFKHFHDKASGTKSVVGRRSIWSAPKFSLRKYGLLTAGLLTLAGGIILFAATPNASFNADNGTLTSGATKQACAGSSDGNCVVFGGSTSSNKIIGIIGQFENGSYDYTQNAVQMGAQWYREDVWGDNAGVEFTRCSTYFNYSSDTNCGTQHMLNTIANHGIRTLLLLNYGVGNANGGIENVDFVNPGTCSTSSNYNTCLTQCSSPTYTGTCTSQLGWVQAAVYTAYNYGQGGTFWKGRTDLGSQFMEIGNEVYNPLESSGPWSCVYDTLTVNGVVYHECFDPADYAKMVKLVSIAVTATTNGHVKTLLDSEPKYTTDTQGDSGNWPHDMLAAVPDLASYVGGVTVHPYGDIPNTGVCVGSPCSTSSNFSYPNNLQLTHQAWPTLPVYVTEVGQQSKSVGYTGQCKAINQYFDDLRANSWEAGLFIFSQKGWSTGGYDLVQGPDPPPGTLEPGWYAYQSQALHQKDYSSC